MRSLFVLMLAGFVALSAQAAPVVVLDGPQADAWRQLLSAHASIASIQDIGQMPQPATLVIPDRLLTKDELAQLHQLPPSVRVLAIGRSAYSENGSSAARVLRVGKHFQYIPLLYPKWLNYDMNRYEQIARWCAQQGAQGMGVFSYAHTLPDSTDKPNFEVIRDVFGSYESWKTQEVLDAPHSPGLKRTPLVLFLHKNDTQRVGPEQAVDWARKLNANTISVEVSRMRTRGVYPSRFTQSQELEYQGKMLKPDNDLDYLPRLLAAARKTDVAVHANIMTKHSPRPTEPGERQVMSSEYTAGKEPQREAPCPLSGAMHYDDMAAIAQEILSLYPQIAAIELDEPRIYNQRWTDWACFCPACRESFCKRYGYELTPANVIDSPQNEDETLQQHTTAGGRQTINADFRDFRMWMMNELVLEKFRRAMNRVRPEAALVVWQPRTYEAFGFSPSAIMYGVSVFGPEYMDGPGSPRYLSHPEAFYPRQERIVQAVDAQSGQAHALSAEIVRVDLFDQALPLLWGEAEDGSRWALLTSAGEGRVMYVAFDPLRDGGKAEDVLRRVRDWIGK